MGPCPFPCWRIRSATSSPRTADPLKTLLAALTSSLVLAPPAAALYADPPAAACLSWRATSEDARALVKAPGRLDGLDVVVVFERATDLARAEEVARALAARGAAVAVEVSLESGRDDIA